MLEHFKNLRYLTTPYEGLLGHRWAATRILQDILPPNLEELHITWPSISIIGWLENIVRVLSAFPSLCEIHMYPREYRGDGWETFAYNYHPMWSGLAALGIYVQVLVELDGLSSGVE